MSELPFQTYERFFGRKWPGGQSAGIVELLNSYHIPYPPGSAEANLSLQARLLAEHGWRAVQP